MKKFSYQKNKYLNKKVVVDNMTFDSKKEAKRYKMLKLLEKSGEIKELKRQVRFKLIDSMTAPSGTKYRPTYYIADFEYFDKKNNYIVEDVKSDYTRKNPLYIIKKKLMLEKYNIEIKEI